MDALIGIDVGTSSCKISAFGTDGELLIRGRKSYPTYYTREGWAEQDAHDWWKCICELLSGIMSDEKMKGVSVRGIGVDGQGWSVIPVDRMGRVLCRNPIWLDTRAGALCEEYAEKIGENRIFEVCGNPWSASYSLPKVLWFRQYRPDIFRETDCFLQSNSYIVYKLTGNKTQDYSQSYGYQCFSSKNKDWDPAMCRLFEIDPGLFPPLFQSDEIVGTVTAEAAAATGLPEGVPVAAGGLDAACGSLGAGVIDGGQTQEQGGQAEGISVCLEKYASDPRLIMSCHVVPGRWLLQGGTTGGGGVIDWIRDACCGKEKQDGGNVYAQMDRLSAGVPAGSDGLIFLPYMRGERSPIWNPKAKGVYYGLDYKKTRAWLIRAAQEGVAYSLRHNIETAEEAGAQIHDLISTGGSTGSRVFMQIKADVTGKTIRAFPSETGTTWGAAILAGIGTGIFDNYHEAVRNTARGQEVYYPDPKKKAIYDDGFARYLDVYEHLKDLMQ